MDKIIGLGNTSVDVLATLGSDETLAEMELPKGSMAPVDGDKLLKISKCFSRVRTHQATGGPAGSVIRAVAQLGMDTGFIGKVNNDFYGRFFEESLLKRGTEANLSVPDTLPSGVTSTSISPDEKRTLGTYSGAASTLKAEELLLEMFKEYTYLFIEGYLMQEHDMILRVVELAKETGLQACLDMASYNTVAGDHGFFLPLIDKYVDTVFTDEEEVKAFTGKKLEETLDITVKMYSITIIEMGACSSLIRKGTRGVHVKAVPVKNVVDTTGAGDFFAADFLHGLACSYSSEECRNIGSTLSGEAIQVIKTGSPDSKWEKIKKRIIMTD